MNGGEINYERTSSPQMLEFGLWYRFEEKIDNKFRRNRYIGSGVHWMVDNIDKQSFTTMYANMGLSATYYSIGCYVEFSQIFYDMDPNIKKGINDNAISVGLYMKF